jgi:hypothetical protein
MGCEICGRNSCTKSFHSLEEQEAFDNLADDIKQRAIDYISHRVKRLDGHYHGDNFYIKLDDAINTIENYW